MNDIDKSVWGVIKQHWLTILGGLFVMFSIYTNDATQTKNITDLESRVNVLEHNKADSDTKWAVLQVQMTGIQSDLADIKTQLKKGN